MLEHYFTVSYRRLT